MRTQETVPDVVHINKVKLRFISETFGQAIDDGREFTLSAEAMNGFYYILEDIENDLEEVYERLTALQKPA